MVLSDQTPGRSIADRRPTTEQPPVERDNPRRDSRGSDVPRHPTGFVRKYNYGHTKSADSPKTYRKISDVEKYLNFIERCNKFYSVLI